MVNSALPFRLRDVEWLGAELGLPMPRALASTDNTLPLLDLGELTAFPGLINSHDHLEFNCYPPTGNPPYGDFLEWSKDVQQQKTLIDSVEAIPVATRVQIGLLKNLLWGVTSVVDHTARAARTAPPIRIISDFDFVHSPEIAERSWRRFLNRWRNIPLVMHAAEGVTEESRARALYFLRHQSRRVAVAHGVALRDDDFALLAALIWCPASNFFLFGKTADAATAKHAAGILFGTDSFLSAPGTLWDHLRLAHRTHMLSQAELLAVLTVRAAKFWNIAPQWPRDEFVIARRRPGAKWDAFLAITPQDILVVRSKAGIVLIDEAIAEKFTQEFSSFETLRCGDAVKRVAMPVSAMFAGLMRANPDIDMTALLARLTGAAA